VAKTIVKRLLYRGFRRTDKAMGEVYQCWWRICRQCHVFYVLYSFVTYLVNLPRIYMFHTILTINGNRFPKQHCSIIIITVMQCVFSAVRTDFLIIVQMNFDVETNAEMVRKLQIAITCLSRLKFSRIKHLSCKG
jgi:hypothetical protein